MLEAEASTVETAASSAVNVAFSLENEASVVGMNVSSSVEVLEEASVVTGEESLHIMHGIDTRLSLM